MNESPKQHNWLFSEKNRFVAQRNGGREALFVCINPCEPCSIADTTPEASQGGFRMTHFVFVVHFIPFE